MISFKFCLYFSILGTLLVTTTTTAQASRPGSVLVVEGGQVDIRCLGGNGHHRDEIMRHHYTWTDSQGNKLSFDHFLDLGKGRIRLVDAKPEDTGLYTCTAMTATKELLVSYYITVFRYPTVTYTDEFQYEVDEPCTQSLAVEVQEVVKEELCKPRRACNYRITTNCQMNHRSSLVKVQTYLHLSSDYQIPNCSISCVIRDIHQQLSREHVVLEEMLLSKVLKHTGLVSALLTESYQRSEQKICPAGHQPYGSHICVACSPGQFNPTPGSQCFPCEVGFYQDLYGQSVCRHCSVGLTTQQTGANSSVHCIEPGAMSVMTCRLNTNAVGVVSLVMVIFMASSCTLGLMYYRLRKRIRREGEYKTKSLDDMELGMEVTPSMKSFLNKNPLVEIEGQTYVPYKPMKSSKYDSLLKLMGLSAVNKTSQSENVVASKENTSLEDEAPILMPAKTRSNSQPNIFPSLERRQPLLGQITKNRVQRGPRAGKLQKRHLCTEDPFTGSDC